MKQLKVFSISLAFAANAMLAAPVGAAVNPDPICLLLAGCYWDRTSEQWICPDPAAYMLCVS